MRKLTVDDIVDHRAYEREREEFRAGIIEMKQRRRIALGDIITIVFENTDTMRFQVQEMARAERMLTDEAIAHEVETYNELIPGPGELSGTLFIEITNDATLREWLPKLIGIEFAVRFELGDSSSHVKAVPTNEERLTRDDITSTVHYLKFPFDAHQRAQLAFGPAYLVVDHPAYQARTELHVAQHDSSPATSPPDVMEIRVQRLDPELPLPQQQHTDDAGYDLHARERVELPAGGGRALVPTGLAIAIPSGYAGFVLPRSGLALKSGVTCLNTPGLIDPLYRGELKVLLVNTDPSTAYTVERGDRIAQLVIQRVEQVDWQEVDQLDTTERDSFGFGSTGV